jgi:hypothetical protein
MLNIKKTNKYAWKRYWCSLESHFPVSGNEFFYQTGAFFGSRDNSYQTLDSMRNIPCLVLLGEPGMGKTYALNDEIAELKATVTETIYINLAYVRSRNELRAELLSDGVIKRCKEKGTIVHIFLDSLDESALNPSEIFSQLNNLLKDVDRERLFLRIASRISLWKQEYVEILQNLWPSDDNNIEICKLLPLLVDDVTIAARLLPEDGARRFVEEITQKRVEPLASRPITLIFLLKLFGENGCFPDSQKELYKQGCLLLCDKINNVEPKLESRKRLALCGRIAAASIFSNRSLIYASIPNKSSSDIIQIDDLLIDGYCVEAIGGVKVEVDERNILDALNTALFHKDSQGHYCWAHRSYAEFLAAWYVCKHNVNMDKIRQWIFNQDVSERKIIPLLQETAAWISLFSPKIFEELINLDPISLLTSSIFTFGPDSSALMADELFKLVDLNDGFYDASFFIPYLSKLKHPGLTLQISNMINNNITEAFTLKLAIATAMECKLPELQDKIIAIAVDEKADSRVRYYALRYLENFADEKTKLSLKTYIEGAEGKNLDRGLKHAILEILWPGLLSTRELFEHIGMPKQVPLISIFDNIFNRILPKHFESDKATACDVLAGLKWAEKYFDECLHNQSYNKLLDRIILKAFEFLLNEEIAELLIKIFLLRWTNRQKMLYDSDLRQKLEQLIVSREPERRKLISSCIQHLLKYKEKCEYDHIIYMLPVIDIDIPWLLQNSAAENCVDINRIISDIVKAKFRWGNIINAEAFFITSIFQKILQKIPAVLADGELVPQLPLEQRVEKGLEGFESKVLNAWNKLVFEMSYIDENSAGYYPYLDMISNLPVWRELDEKIKAKVLEVALKLIKDADQPAESLDEYFKDGKITFGMIAGLQALFLIAEERKNWLKELSEEDWKKWAPIIYIHQSAEEGSLILQLLLSSAYQFATSESLATISKIIDKEDKSLKSIFIIDKIDWWDDGLAKLCWSKVQKNELWPESFIKLLCRLLKEKHTEAKRYTRNRVFNPLPTDESSRIRISAAAVSLVQNLEKTDWKHIWISVLRDEDFGKSLFLTLSAKGIVDFWKKLSEEELTETYIWLLHKFPMSDSLNEFDAHLVTPEEKLADWRSQILDYLVKLGTKNAVIGLKKIVDEFPQHPQFRNFLSKAQENLIQSSWSPIPVDVLIKNVIAVTTHELEPEAKTFIHSPDYRSCRYKEDLYLFTTKQARAVQILHQNYEQGTPDVGIQYILEEIGAKDKTKIQNVFRDHPAWRKLIVLGQTKGTIRLNL